MKRKILDSLCEWRTKNGHKLQVLFDVQQKTKKVQKKLPLQESRRNFAAIFGLLWNNPTLYETIHPTLTFKDKQPTMRENQQNNATYYNQL